MADSIQEDPIPSTIRIAGWIAVCLGALMAVVALINLFSYAIDPESLGFSSDQSATPVLDFLFSHLKVLLLLHALSAIVLIVAGIGFTQGKRRARYALIAVLSLGLVLFVFIGVAALAFLFAPLDMPFDTGTSFPSTFRSIRAVMSVFVVFFTLSLVSILYLAVRWLRSSFVKSACHY